MTRARRRSPLSALLLFVVVLNPLVSAARADPSYPYAVRSGVGALDGTLAVVQSGDAAQLAAAVELAEVPCTSDARGARIPRPPRCRAGEPEGTPVDAFLGQPTAGCTPAYFRASRVGHWASEFFSTHPRPYAAFRSAKASGVAAAGTTTVLFVTGRGGEVLAVDSSGGITGIGLGLCGKTPSSVFAGSRGAVVLGPRARPLKVTKGDAPAYPAGALSGNPSADAVIAAVAADDVAKLMALAHFKRVPCVRKPPHATFPQPPICERGEPTGKLIDVMITSGGCETFYARRDLIEQRMGLLVAETRGVYGAATIPGDRTVAPGGVDLLYTPPSGVPWPDELFLDKNGRIVVIFLRACDTAQELLHSSEGRVLLGPRER